MRKKWIYQEKQISRKKYQEKNINNEKNKPQKQIKISRMKSDEGSKKTENK